MKKHVKKVAVVTAMCGAMLMSSCTKREMLTPVAPPTEATQESPTDAPGIYIETSDGVVHNTGLRATASETREWTSPDGTIRVSGLGSYAIRDIENSGITVKFKVGKEFVFAGYAYRFEGVNPVTDEAQKKKDRVWIELRNVGANPFGTASPFIPPTGTTMPITFLLPTGNAYGEGRRVIIPEGTRKILLTVGGTFKPIEMPSFKTFLEELHRKEGEKRWTEGISHIPDRFEQEALNRWQKFMLFGSLYSSGIDDVVDYLIKEAEPEGWMYDYSEEIENSRSESCMMSGQFGERYEDCGGYGWREYEYDMEHAIQPGPWSKEGFAKDMEKYRAFLKKKVEDSGYVRATAKP